MATTTEEVLQLVSRAATNGYLWCCGEGVEEPASEAGEHAERLLLGSNASKTFLQQHAGEEEDVPLQQGLPLRCVPDVSSGQLKGSMVVVMRHAHRQDEEDNGWHRLPSTTRPWDPPLSALGRTQARAVGEVARLKGVDVVVSSPFLRCLQTSAEIVAQLGIPQGNWLVDWQLSEVLEPRIIFAGRPDAMTVIRHKATEAWMWMGRPMEAALTQFASQERTRSKVLITPVQRPGCLAPSCPEDLASGRARYRAAIRDIMHAYEGHKVLVVSHGEAVREAVVMHVPDAEVYEVKHTAYAVWLQDPSELTWYLDGLSGQSGVSWLGADDEEQ